MGQQPSPCMRNIFSQSSRSKLILLFGKYCRSEASKLLACYSRLTLVLNTSTIPYLLRLLNVLGYKARVIANHPLNAELVGQHAVVSPPKHILHG